MRDSFDSLTNSDRDRLFGHDLSTNLDQPITVAGLTEAFAQEIVDNVILQVFDNQGCTTENPGKVRTPPPSGAESLTLQ